MSDITVQKTPTGWVPADEPSRAVHSKQKLGAVISADFKQARNYQFHKKLFALLNLAFDYWDISELEYKGEKVTKNFDRFRKDVTIIAGFYEPTYNIRNEVRLEAKSISFASMSQDDFDALYNAVLNVLLERVLKAKGFTRETVDELVDQLMSFH